MIKVSVIVPVWNAEKYLRQCLNSIVNQTLNEIEIILINDGSTDSSLLICQEFAHKDKRVHVYTQSNKGAGLTRNYGIKLARGEYLSFLDADDFFEPNMLEKMYCKAKNTNADIVACNFWLFNDEIQKDFTKEWSVRKEKLPSKKVFSAADCPDDILNIFWVVWNQMYKRDFIIEKKLYYQNLKNSNDVFFVATTLFTSSKITFLDQYLVHHRYYNGSTITRREEDWKAPFKAIKAVKNFLVVRKHYKIFEITFLRKAFNLLYSCRTMKEPVLGIWQNAMVKNFLPSLFKISDYNLLPDYHTKAVNQLFQKKNLSPLLEYFYYYKRNKIIPIVFAINEEHCSHIMATIQSIKNHTNFERFYDIYILYTDLTGKLINSLEELTDDNIRVSCLDISEKMKEITLQRREHFPFIMYYRLFIPELFYGYKKIIYLEANTIIESDLTELFDLDFKEAWISALKTEGAHQQLQNRKNCIFSSDIILFNIIQWRKENLTQKYKEKNPHILATLMKKKETLYSDMAKYVCGTLISFFCFGKKKKKLREKLESLLMSMYKKV